MDNTNKAALIILDGWGIGENNANNNAIYAANTPFYDSLLGKYPHATLKTYGTNVGLPEGQMGNSEVGHLNIGAGRVVYQMLALINKAFSNNELDSHPVIQSLISTSLNNNKPIHLIGLVSDGGVHSHINHLLGLCDIFNRNKVKNVYIHIITDGRDTDPKSGIGFIKQVIESIKGTDIKIASVCGRYYAMDRDKRWERTQKAYDLLVNNKGKRVQIQDLLVEMNNNYEEGVTDEFILPINIVDEEDNPLTKISDGDSVLFFNFRTDRGRQLTQALTQEAIDGMSPIPLKYITFTQYDKTYKGIEILFKEQDLSNTIGEVIEKAGLSQLRVAETEKYPHVTFFFSGGRETPFQNEDRILVPSPKVATYDLQPTMSALEITDRTIEKVKTNHPNLLILNYANPDMVGHTGVFSSIVKAIETIDSCLSRLIPVLLEDGYEILITADHGNADFAVNEDGTPNTAHTTNPVPIIYVSNENKKNIREGKLADLSPTLLNMLSLQTPLEMDGTCLLIGD